VPTGLSPLAIHVFRDGLQRPPLPGLDPPLPAEILSGLFSPLPNRLQVVILSPAEELKLFRNWWR